MAAQQQRIVGAVNANVCWGHWATCAGAPYLGNAFGAPAATLLSDARNWLVQCGTNGYNYMSVFATNVGIAQGMTLSAGVTWGINSWSGGEQSSFGVAEVILYSGAVRPPPGSMPSADRLRIHAPGPAPRDTAGRRRF